MEKEPDIIQSFIKLGCKCGNNGYHLYDIQKWLREVKKIYVNPVDYILPYSKIAMYELSFEMYNNASKRLNEAIKTKLESKIGLYNTYEEALEAGIWESYFLINN